MRSLRFAGRGILSVICAFVCGGAIAGPASRPAGLEARVACHERIERVYWRHRIWPDGNRPRPSFHEVIPRAAVERKAEDSVLLSNALEQVWNRPITPAHLQAEIDRMVRDTRNPAMLRELFRVLDNDPHLVAECLARPGLARRLAHNWYGELSAAALSSDALSTPRPSFTEWWASARVALRNIERPEMTWQRYTLPTPDANGCTADTWEPTANDSPDPRDNHIAIWTGTEMIVWGGQGGIGGGSLRNGHRYDPATDTWSQLSRVNAPEGEVFPSAIWTGSEMIIWGGFGSSAWVDTGARYDPTTDTWTATSTGANVPAARRQHTAVWTGSEMIVWGGAGDATYNSGARYDPAADSWTSLPAVAISERHSHTAVWSGSEMIIWGGNLSLTSLNTGARYSPATNNWTLLPTAGAPEGRVNHSAVWTGSEMIIWGGDGTSSNMLDSGARFNPTTNSWTPTPATDAPSARYDHTAIWTGSEMIVFGGLHDVGPFFARTNTGARYTPGAAAWTTIPVVAETPEFRMLHTALWTGTEMIVWGGNRSAGGILSTGGRYEPVSGTWVPTAEQGLTPAAIGSGAATWIGTEMMILSTNVDQYGALYDPALDSWTPTSLVGAPFLRGAQTAVWTGQEIIYWGQNGGVSDGGIYDPVLDHWTPVTTTGAPTPRARHSAVWTGSEMIVAGQEEDFGRYDPLSDRWTTATPDPFLFLFLNRTGHATVWTGREMILWGGSVPPGTILPTGIRYDPHTDTWEEIATTGGPPGTTGATAVWTGDEMIVWGGETAIDVVASGGRYDPDGDSWAPVSQGAGTPTAREDHTAVWTGDEMIIWGGIDDSGLTTNSGAQYDPPLDAWTALSSTGAPQRRSLHEAVYTDQPAELMIVWGGLRPVSASGGTYCAPCNPVTWYLDADADGHGIPGSTVTSCARPAGFAALPDDCDDACAACFPGNTEICDGFDNDCNMFIDDVSLVPGLVADLSAGQSGGTIDLQWAAAVSSDTYDVARGSGLLLLSGGDPGAAFDHCLVDDSPLLNVSDPVLPPLGDAYLYVVRGGHCGDPGTYDSGGAQQQGSRDAALTAVCP